jgi:Ca-activated chloride channel family protein
MRRALTLLLACQLSVGCAQQNSGDVARSPAPTAADYELFSEIPAGMTASESFTLPVDTPEEIQEFNTEAYDTIIENEFLLAQSNPLSTFSIDVDTASYSNVRRFLTHGQLPPPGAVRIEELVNYFSYDYPCPEGDIPFAVNAEIASCPWAPEHRLIRFGLKGRLIEQDSRPVSNLVFLIDVSGSMADQNKLPLVKDALRLLLEQLGENDRVAIVVYAGSSGLVLPSTTADQKPTIRAALENLYAGGSTNGGEGIELAYRIAVENYINGGVNRVVLCTDGDFNVGITDQSSLERLIEDKAASGVALSVLGFGMGNYKDATVEQLADKGNGNYAYIDTLSEARKVLVEQMSGTLVTIARDVKIQVDFNPEQVAAYRLIGYENRMLKAEDFDNDAKDAGEIGAGHTVTALYEIVPVGMDVPVSSDAPQSKYQQPAALSDSAMTDELLTLHLRYKQPDGVTSSELEFPIRDSHAEFGQASDDFQFAAAVAAFGMLLRDSEFKGNATYAAVAEWAQPAIGADPFGYRAEFLQLVSHAGGL